MNHPRFLAFQANTFCFYLQLHQTLLTMEVITKQGDTLASCAPHDPRDKSVTELAVLSGCIVFHLVSGFKGKSCFLRLYNRREAIIPTTSYQYSFFSRTIMEWNNLATFTHY